MFWLRWGFVALHGLSLAVASGNYSLVAGCELVIEVAALIAEHGL